jgi:hypothetical protein
LQQTREAVPERDGASIGHRMANTCEINVGRLMEIRVADGYHSVRDIERMISMMQAYMSTLAAGEKYVIAADWRNVGMMAPETAARAREMLARANPRVLRSAILSSPDQSLANLQLVRLIREAESPSRRHFISTDEHYRWLAEVLTEPERTRLTAFLSTPQGAEPPRSTEPPRSVDLSRSVELPRSVELRTVDLPRSLELPRSAEPPHSARLPSLRPSLLDPLRRTTRPGGTDP